MRVKEIDDRPVIARMKLDFLINLYRNGAFYSFCTNVFNQRIDVWHSEGRTYLALLLKQLQTLRPEKLSFEEQGLLFSLENIVVKERV